MCIKEEQEGGRGSRGGRAAATYRRELSSLHLSCGPT